MDAPYPDKVKYGAYLPFRGKYRLGEALYRYYYVNANIPFMEGKLREQYEKWIITTGTGILKFMADYLLAACLGEVRHLWRSSNGYSQPVDEDVKILLHPRSNAIIHYRYESSQKGWGMCLDFKSCSLALQKAFLQYSWLQGMGGVNWAHSAYWAYELYKIANNPDPVERIVGLESAMDAVHNGNNQFMTGKFDWAAFRNVHSAVSRKAMYVPLCYETEYSPSSLFRVLTLLKKKFKDLPKITEPCNSRYRLSRAENEVSKYLESVQRFKCPTCHHYSFLRDSCLFKCPTCSKCVVYQAYKDQYGYVCSSCITGEKKS